MREDVAVQAWICRKFGNPAVLESGQLPSVKVDQGQIRILVRAVGLNLNDLLALEGKHHLRPELPFAPGGEVSGIVTEIGNDVTQFQVGQRVMAMTEGGIGGLAEEVVVDAWAAVPFPASMDFVTAAAFLSSYFTAYDAVICAGHAEPGETVLVLGAAGGVGAAAIDIAKALGCRVLAVARSAEKCARAAKADAMIDASMGSYSDEILRLTGGKGVNVVIDPVGGEAFREALRCTAYDGRIVVAGFASGDIPQLRSIQLLLRGISLSGCNLSLRAQRTPERFQRAGEQLFQWYEAGMIHPMAVTAYPFDRATEALARISARDRVGKIVVKLNPERD